ncbi:MAG: hypothetical protein Q8L08_10890 [Candidatus Nanopelagicaceae bacterium]|nr:hypothetical protein [Candidatus Nanopelagicaceae bacterium]
MKKTLIAVVLIAGLALTACGKKAETAATPTESATPSATATVSNNFDSPITVGTGITVTISKPTTFTPGQFASNYLPGQAANVFTATLKNESGSEIDPATISLVASSGSNTCTDVLDGDNGISGAPTEPIATASEVNFKFAIGCDAKSGQPLHIDITIGTTTAALDGTVA